MCASLAGWSCGHCFCSCPLLPWSGLGRVKAVASVRADVACVRNVLLNGGGVRAGDAGVESWLQQEMDRGSHDTVHPKDIFVLSRDQSCRHQVLGKMGSHWIEQVPHLHVYIFFILPAAETERPYFGKESEEPKPDWCTWC